MNGTKHIIIKTKYLFVNKRCHTKWGFDIKITDRQCYMM